MTDRLSPFSIDVSAESVARWMMGRDDRLPDPLPENGDPVPLSYLFFLRIQPVTSISIHEELNRDPDRGLFGGVRYERHRAVRVGDRLSGEAIVTDRKVVESPKGEMLLTTLENTWSAGDGKAVTETVRMVDLPPELPTAPAAGPDADTTLTLMGEPVAFTRRQIAWLTVETGDLNPLHVDADYAKSREFPDVVVPGTLIVPRVEKVLSESWDDALKILDVRFRAPTFPGEAISIHAADDDDGGIKFEVCGGGTVRAAGRAVFGVTSA